MDDVSTANPRVHAICDDALGRHDAVGLAALLRRGEVSSAELVQAAIARAGRVQQLNAVEVQCYDSPRSDSVVQAARVPFSGLPTFVKDNVDLAGLPTRHGSRALPSKPARRDDPIVQHLLAQGLVVLGKTRLPEFGFSPSTEFESAEPVRNPWNPAYSSGGSSGGAAALVAAGVVPIAHGNDGGGSVRIPAALNGLVGLKVTRGRLPFSTLAAGLPLKIIVDGVLTRSVRDTAHFIAASERTHRCKLPKVGLVEGPAQKRLRIGLVLDAIGGADICPQTRVVVEKAASKLEQLGHDVVPLTLPVPEFFVEDFKLYWSFLSSSLCGRGTRLLDPEFDSSKVDALTRGLSRYFKKRTLKFPLALLRLSASSWAYAWFFRRFDAVLSPVLTQTTPRLGYLSPALPFDELFERIVKYTAFTPLNNATGGPAIAIPGGISSEGLPLGIHVSAAHGAERTLLEIAYELEAESEFPRIDRVETW